MHKGLSDIVSKFNVPMSERSCYYDYMYDGSTIAMNYQRENWDKDFENLICLSAPIRLPDFDLAHEIAHWVVASPEEREFPEYGCDGGIAGHGSSHHPDGKESVEQNVLTEDEQSFREMCADMLGVYWCTLLGIPFPEAVHPVYKYHDHPAFEVPAWRAIIWLREKGLMQ